MIIVRTSVGARGTPGLLSLRVVNPLLGDATRLSLGIQVALETTKDERVGF